MKARYRGVLNTVLLVLLVVGIYVIKNPIKITYVSSPPDFSTTNPLEWKKPGGSPALLNPKNYTNSDQVLSNETVTVSDLIFSQKNLSNVEQNALLAWNYFTNFTTNDQVLPNATEAIKGGFVAWKKLMISVEEEKLQINGSLQKGKHCPRFLSKMNASEVDANGYKMQIPCGLTRGSSITFTGIIPHGLACNFRVDLTGEPLPGEQDPPIIVHYNITALDSDSIMEDDSVIVQNTWTIAHGWGEEQRCPSANREKNKTVDELDMCNDLVGRDYNHAIEGNLLTNGSTEVSLVQGGKPSKYFPFKKNELFVATLSVGSEGIHMTVDGNHITSFAFHEILEPWLVGGVRISGDVSLISVVASGLPTSEYLEYANDTNALKPVPLPSREELNLFIGVLSTANNFKRRMAVRKSWMQYPAVRSGQVAVRFFVGLQKNHTVNEDLWKEARTYEDIQVMPFLDNYSLITWKTIAICICGTQVVSAKFIMKTDDDSFVNVDEILNSLDRINVTSGLLYGLIYSNLPPHREPDSKWYTTPEEWPDDKYPPWASGPGYVVSKDIAESVSKKHTMGQLKMFKLEDVAMGIWIIDLKKKGLEIKYEKDDRIYYEGCMDGFVVAHQQGPGELLCLWKKIQEKKVAKCCGN